MKINDKISKYIGAVYNDLYTRLWKKKDCATYDESAESISDYTCEDLRNITDRDYRNIWLFEFATNGDKIFNLSSVGGTANFLPIKYDGDVPVSFTVDIDSNTTLQTYDGFIDLYDATNVDTIQISEDIIDINIPRLNKLIVESLPTLTSIIIGDGSGTLWDKVFRFQKEVDYFNIMFNEFRFCEFDASNIRMPRIESGICYNTKIYNTSEISVLRLVNNNFSFLLSNGNLWDLDRFPFDGSLVEFSNSANTLNDAIVSKDINVHDFSNVTTFDVRNVASFNGIEWDMQYFFTQFSSLTGTVIINFANCYGVAGNMPSTVTQLTAYGNSTDFNRYYGFDLSTVSPNLTLLQFRSNLYNEGILPTAVANNISLSLLAMSNPLEENGSDDWFAKYNFAEVSNSLTIRDCQLRPEYVDREIDLSTWKMTSLDITNTNFTPIGTLLRTDAFTSYTNNTTQGKDDTFVYDMIVDLANDPSHQLNGTINCTTTLDPLDPTLSSAISALQTDGWTISIN